MQFQHTNPLGQRYSLDKTVILLQIKIIGHTKDIYKPVCSRSSPNEHFHLQTAILMATFTKPHFNLFSTPCIQTLYFHIFMGSQLQFWTPLSHPEGDSPLTRASNVLAVNQREPVFLVCTACFVKELYDDLLPLSQILKEKKGAFCWALLPYQWGNYIPPNIVETKLPLNEIYQC